eukprot:g31465.t2
MLGPFPGGDHAGRAKHFGSRHLRPGFRGRWGLRLSLQRLTTRITAGTDGASVAISYDEKGVRSLESYAKEIFSCYSWTDLYYHLPKSGLIQSVLAKVHWSTPIAFIGRCAVKPTTCTVAFSGATGLNFVAGIMNSSPVKLRRTSQGVIEVVPEHEEGGHRFHSFYWTIYEAMRSQIGDQVTTALKGCEHITVTGHSIGAALAAVFQWEHMDLNIQQITMGQNVAWYGEPPDVGCRGKRLYSIDDPVPQLRQFKDGEDVIRHAMVPAQTLTHLKNSKNWVAKRLGSCSTDEPVDSGCVDSCPYWKPYYNYRIATGIMDHNAFTYVQIIDSAFSYDDPLPISAPSINARDPPFAKEQAPCQRTWASSNEAWRTWFPTTLLSLEDSVLQHLFGVGEEELLSLGASHVCKHLSAAMAKFAEQVFAAGYQQLVSCQGAVGSVISSCSQIPLVEEELTRAGDQLQRTWQIFLQRASNDAKDGRGEARRGLVRLARSQVELYGLGSVEDVLLDQRRKALELLEQSLREIHHARQSLVQDGCVFDMTTRLARALRDQEQLMRWHLSHALLALFWWQLRQQREQGHFEASETELPGLRFEDICCRRWDVAWSSWSTFLELGRCSTTWCCWDVEELRPGGRPVARL